MAERTEWRQLYGTRHTLFVGGVGVGDYYPTSQGVYRVRLWPEDRLQGGRERLVLDEAVARAMLVEMLGRARGEAVAE